jgi:hypothetical protein
MRPAISTEISLAFLCFYTNAEMVPNFLVAAECFSFDPFELN